MIKLKVSRLLKQRGLTATDLMRAGNISYVTALRLSKDTATAISFEVLDNLCKMFGVGIDEIIEYIAESNTPKMSK